MKSKDLHLFLVQELSRTYDAGEARAIARIVIEDVLGLSITRTLAGLEPDLTPQQQTIIAQALERLSNHEPIQHITGYATFCGLNFRVSPAVLIPRPETEQLVEIVYAHLRSNLTANVIDACTGSGCIAISLKKQNPTWRIEAFDISDEALTVAKANAQNNNADIAFHKTNLLGSNLPPGPFDLIVSNPPYIMDKEKETMDPNVLNHEPHLALFVTNEDPLVFYRALGNWGRNTLTTNGILAVEINAKLSKETAQLFETQQYQSVQILQDCFGKDRFIVCQK